MAAPTIESERRVPSSILGEPSEAELRPDEAICPVTGYVYLAALGRSPHLDETGRRV